MSKDARLKERFNQPRVRLVQSPWDAALSTGSVDAAFQDVPSRGTWREALSRSPIIFETLAGGGPPLAPARMVSPAPISQSHHSPHVDVYKPKPPQGWAAPSKPAKLPDHQPLGSLKLEQLFAGRPRTPITLVYNASDNTLTTSAADNPPPPPKPPSPALPEPSEFLSFMSTFSKKGSTTDSHNKQNTNMDVQFSDKSSSNLISKSSTGGQSKTIISNVSQTIKKEEFSSSQKSIMSEKSLESKGFKNIEHFEVNKNLASLDNFQQDSAPPVTVTKPKPRPIIHSNTQNNVNVSLPNTNPSIQQQSSSSTTGQTKMHVDEEVTDLCQRQFSSESCQYENPSNGAKKPPHLVPGAKQIFAPTSNGNGLLNVGIPDGRRSRTEERLSALRATPVQHLGEEREDSPYEKQPVKSLINTFEQSARPIMRYKTSEEQLPIPVVNVRNGSQNAGFKPVLKGPQQRTQDIQQTNNTSSIQQSQFLAQEQEKSQQVFNDHVKIIPSQFPQSAAPQPQAQIQPQKIPIKTFAPEVTPQASTGFQPILNSTTQFSQEVSNPQYYVAETKVETRTFEPQLNGTYNQSFEESQHSSFQSSQQTFQESKTSQFSAVQKSSFMSSNNQQQSIQKSSTDFSTDNQRANMSLNLQNSAAPAKPAASQPSSQKFIQPPTESLTPKLQDVSSLNNFNTAPRGWAPKMDYYRPVFLDPAINVPTFTDF